MTARLEEPTESPSLLSSWSAKCELVGPIGTVATHSLTLGAALSALVGTWVTFCYLQSVGAPLLSLDFGAVVTIALTLGFLFLVLGAFPFIPALLNRLSGELVKKTFAALNDPHLKLRSKTYLASYLIYFFPFVLTSIVFTLFLFLSLFIKVPIWMIWPLLVAAIWLGLARLKAWAIRNQHETKDIRLLRWDCFSTNILTIFWFIAGVEISITLSPAIQPRNLPDWLYLFMFVVALLLLHYATIRLRLRQLVALFATLVLALTFSLGPAYLGGATLRFLGFGGGAPVTILVKGLDTNTDKTLTKSISGCLVLGIGSDLLIKSALHRSDFLLHVTATNIGKQRLVTAYDTVYRYARADILKISKFQE